MMSQYSVPYYNMHTHVKDGKTKESWKNTSRTHLLRFRLYLKLQMLEELCVERLSLFPDAKKLLNNIVRIKQLLTREPYLTVEQLENLMEYCKIYIYKRLYP